MKKYLLCLVVLLGWDPASAEDTVVLGRLWKNVPMEYVADTCPENSICLQSWWKWVIDIDKTVSGPPASGRIVAARPQHTSLYGPNLSRFRLFVLRPIVDQKQRKRLRADYYLEDVSFMTEMYCLAQNPTEFGLSPERTFISGDGEERRYCFELPDKDQ